MKNKTAIKVTALIVALIVLLGFLLSTTLFTNIKIRAITPAPPRVNGKSANTTARAMCTLDLETGRVFYEHNADARLPMASTTKIVTAITVIDAFAETGRDLNEKIKIDDKAIGIEGTSIYLQKGEQLTARELLLGLMLRSGNDAASALALSVKPTIPEFAALMNQTANRAGAKNSSFKNPHGLDEEGHYTTARDLAKITAYAMKNPTFAEIVKTRQARIDGAEYPRVLHNKNRLLKSLIGCTGVKTGFTKKAGRCFVGSLESNGRTTICTVLNCGPMFEETEKLMTAATEQFKKHHLITADEFIKFTKGCEDTVNSDKQAQNAASQNQSDAIAANPEDTHECLCAIAIEDFSYPLSDYEFENQIEIVLDGEEVAIKFQNKEIYRAPCNVL